MSSCVSVQGGTYTASEGATLMCVNSEAGTFNTSKVVDPVSTFVVCELPATPPVKEPEQCPIESTASLAPTAPVKGPVQDPLVSPATVARTVPVKKPVQCLLASTVMGALTPPATGPIQFA